MFCREGDENVRDASLSVSLGVEVPCGRGGRGWDVRAEESIGFGISDDSTVVDDRNSGVLDGCMPSAPRVKGKVSTHKDLSVGVQGFTIDECSHMRTAGWTWEEQKPGHGLCVLRAGDVGGGGRNGALPSLGDFVSLVEFLDWMRILIWMVLETLADTLVLEALELFDDGCAGSLVIKANTRTSGLCTEYGAIK